MSNVFIAFQANEESRPLVDAIVADNPEAQVVYSPGLVKIDAPNRLVVRRETIEEIIGRKVVAEGESFDHAALRLAAAEVRLARAQLAERNLLAVGDDGVRMLPDLYMIQEVVMDEIIFQGKASEDTLRQAQRLEERTLRAGARSAHRQYPRMRRYLREAELAHRAALRDWLTQN